MQMCWLQPPNKTLTPTKPSKPLWNTQEAGHRFKGKIISKLVSYKPGNFARDFFKNVKVPLEPGSVR